MNEKDRLNSELRSINQRVDAINQEIGFLEIEKRNLLERKKQCAQKLNELLPSSAGGSKNDSTSSWNRNDFEWSQRVDACLRETFQLSSFRPLQLETINVTLSKLDCMVVMPTGAGKSICFQLPALIDAGVTLVVSPLVSLMEDQLWILRSLGVRADTLNGTSSKEHVKLIHTEMVDAKSSLKLLYVTPEKLAKSKMFMNKLEKMYELGRFSRLVVDEVHCCSTYGHDFRPDYKFLGVMKRLFPKVPVLGLTATATDNVIEDIKKILSIPKCVLFKASFNRPNIFYEVRAKPSNSDEVVREIAALISAKFPQQSGIVYCFSQRESEQVAQELCSHGIRADSYHAQMEADVRSRVHESWLKNRTHVIVATIAFGMGIDKSNCRFVIHHSMSKSLENFYQESGRAGRDGQPAWSVLYFRFADVFRQSAMVFTEQTGLDNLYSMVNYCINKTTCKRNLIAEHFSDTLWSRTGECNGMCDACSGGSADKEAGKNRLAGKNLINEALLVLEVLDKHAQKAKEKRITGNKLADAVTTELNKHAKSHGNFQRLEASEVERLVLVMVMRKYLKEDFHFTPYNTICYLILGPRAATLFNEKTFYISDDSPSSSSRKETGDDAMPTTSKMSSRAAAFDDDDDDPDDVVCLDEEPSDFKRAKYEVDEGDLYFADD